MIIIFIFLIILQVYSFTPKNYFTNPSFEEGVKGDDTKAVGWSTYGKGCKREKGGRTGNWSVHCVDVGGDCSYLQRVPVGTIQPGLNYNVSAWIKIKNANVTDSNYWMLSVEGCSYSCGVYLRSKNIEECKDGNCYDKWYFISSGRSQMTFKDCQYQATMSLRKDVVGEFWVDDLSFEIVIEDYLYGVDVVSWRQEVFEDEVEVRIATAFHWTVFEKGENCFFTLLIINEKGETVQKSTEFKTWFNFQQVVVSMKLLPKTLTPGMYTARVQFYNNITDRVEVVETVFKKTEKKKEYNIFVDVDNRCFVNGKLFFPIGAYVNTWNDMTADNFTDTSFNLLVSNAVANKERLDRIYERTKGQIRVLNGFESSCRQETVEAAVAYAEERVKQYKESPGLFGYYIADEPGLNWVEKMKAVNWKVRELDQHHITWAAVNDRTNMHRYKEGFDTVGIPCYPLQNVDDLHAIWVMTKQGRQRIGNARAMWNIPQIFDWTVYNKSFPKIDVTKEKPPTENQLRNMVYQWIASGGNGIIFYDFSELVVMHYKNDFFKEWAKVKKVAQELKDKYSAIIMSNIPVNPKYNLPIARGLDYSDYVTWRTFRYNFKDYILIVNPRNVNNYIYTFTKPSTATLKKMSGNSIIEINGDTVTCKMPGMDVLWFEGTDTQWNPDESGYSKPNLKSKFNTEEPKQVQPNAGYLNGNYLVLILILMILFY